MPALALRSQGVRQISVGTKHVLALSDSGDVYAWGTGTVGQLGLGKRRNFPSPQLVWGLMRKGVRQIAAGDAHSIALTYSSMTSHPLNLAPSPPRTLTSSHLHLLAPS